MDLHIITFVKVFTIIIAISAHMNCQTVISNTLSGQEFTCPGSVVKFTCRTTGGILAWRSVDYIGPKNILVYIAELAKQGDRRNTSFNLNTMATLTQKSNNSGQVVLESTLRIVASPDFSSSSVTCINIATNESATSIFSVYPDPGELREPFWIQIRCGSSSRCVINTLWRPPLNADAANVTNYKIRVNGTNPELVPTFDIIDNGTGVSSLLSVSSCATHNVSISTLNGCGESPNTLNFILEPVEIITIPASVCVSRGTSINYGSLTMVIWVMVVIINTFF